MRIVLVMLFGLAAACGNSIPQAVPGTCDEDTTQLPAGNASGDVCGNISAAGSLLVPEGATLTIGKGSVLAMAQDASIEIDGTLVINGAPGAPVTLTSATDWQGLVVAGSLTATTARMFGHNAGIFQSSGTASLTDVEIDEGHADISPDCVTLAGGTIAIDHTSIRGCHCPLHISESDGVTIDNTVLDGADPIMIARANANVHHSHLLALDAAIDDIGGNFTADISGNYYGGGAPTIHVVDGDDGVVSGDDDFEEHEISGVGPRF
jgi:hypothetical protein